MGNEVQGYSIDHAHIITAKQINLFPTDVTYISCLGNNLFINNLQAAMQLFLKKKNSQSSYPPK